MNESDVVRIGEELKKYDLIEKDREIKKWGTIPCIFEAITSKKILFDEELLNFFEMEAQNQKLSAEDLIKFALLHEEGHIVIPQEKTSGSFWSKIISVFYSKMYFQPFWNNEYHSDEYAVMGLLLNQPGLKSWRVLQSIFEATETCQTRRNKPPTNLYKYPPSIERVKKAEKLFYKLQNAKQNEIWEYISSLKTGNP